MALDIAGIRFDVEAVVWASLRGGHDRVLLEEDFLGIADGATPLRPGWPDPGRFAAAALAALSASGRQHQDVGDYWAAAITSLGRRAAAAEPTVSCAVAVVRGRSAAVEAALLGDCTVLLHGVDESVLCLFDDRLRLLDEAAHRQADPDRRRARLLHNRGLMNQASGYWIFAANPGAADHVRHARTAAAGLRSILLYTDGLDAVARTLGFVPPGRRLDEALREAGGQSIAGMLQAVLHRLRHPEHDDQRQFDDIAWIHASRAG